MTFDNSVPEGNITVPVWSDDGIVKPLIDDNGNVPVTGNVTLSDKEIHLYYWDGDSWEKWNPIDSGTWARVYYWDGNAWQKWTGNPISVESQLYYWDGDSWEKWLGSPGYISAFNRIYNGASWVYETTKWVLSLPYYEIIENNDTPADDVTLYTPTVSADTLVVVKLMSITYESDTITRKLLRVKCGGNLTAFLDDVNLTRSIYTTVDVDFTLVYGDKIGVTFYGCSLHDIVALRIFGATYIEG